MHIDHVLSNCLQNDEENIMLYFECNGYQIFKKYVCKRINDMD